MAAPLQFQGDGKNCLWILPWQNPDPASLVVTLRQPGGLERRLAPERDYTVMGNLLMAIVASGWILSVWRAEAGIINEGGPQGTASPQAAQLPNAAHAAQTAQTGQTLADIALATAAEPGPVYIGSDASELEQRLESRAAELLQAQREALEQTGSQIFSQLRQMLKASLEEALAAIGGEGQKVRAEARLARAPLGQRASMRLAEGCQAGAWLDLPVCYLAGTSSLAVYQDGLLLTPGQDYEESGQLNEASSTIRMLGETYAGARLDFLVAAIASSDTAVRAAREAQSAQAQAASLLASARAAQTDAQNSLARSGNDAINAQGWANASQKSANDAYEASCHAWDAATQASIHARRPGICAVREIGDIHACSPGLFIINPHLTHAPTAFFGVWPADSEEDMAWDGIFFLGGKPWPADPALPPKCPPRPAPDPVAAQGAADDWIPCAHSHQPPPHCCPVQCAGQEKSGD